MQDNALVGFTKHAETIHKPLLESLMYKIDGKITQEDLDDACMRWSYLYAIDDLKYKRPPLEPTVVTNFMKETIKKRRKIFEDFTNIRQAVLEFRGKYIGAVNRNKVCQGYLLKMKEFFKGKGELDKVQVIEGALQTY